VPSGIERIAAFFAGKPPELELKDIYLPDIMVLLDTASAERHEPLAEMTVIE
jgi:hypothetical protein